MESIDLLLDIMAPVALLIEQDIPIDAGEKPKTEPVNLLLLLEAPIQLSLSAEPWIFIVPDTIPSDEPLFKQSEAIRFEPGDKAHLDSLIQPAQGERYTGIHPGRLMELSVTDDYLYVCVKEGQAGEAIWKRTILFLSQAT